jgi:ribosomal protein S18 acetylase RimI-like enzyme
MPLFCDQALAQRIERAERRMLVDVCANVRRRLADAYCAPVGGGVAVLTEAGSPLNKVAALGFASLDDAAWAAVEAEHARRGMPVQVELSTLADPAVGAMLTARGYALVGVENVCGRALAPDAAAASPADGDAITIARCEPDELDLCIETTVAGFSAPDTQGVPAHDAPVAIDRATIARVIRDVAAADGGTLFLARRGGAVAGAGAMRLQDGIAQLSGAATLPGHRRRGVQSALLAHRLAHAAAHGHELAVVTTQPGSKSQQNMHRAGFELLYSRLVLVRATG